MVQGAGGSGGGGASNSATASGGGGGASGHFLVFALPSFSVPSSMILKPAPRNVNKTFCSLTSTPVTGTAALDTEIIFQRDESYSIYCPAGISGGAVAGASGAAITVDNSDLLVFGMFRWSATTAGGSPGTNAGGAPTVGLGGGGGGGSAAAAGTTTAGGAGGMVAVTSFRNQPTAAGALGSAGVGLAGVDGFGRNSPLGLIPKLSSRGGGGGSGSGGGLSGAGVGGDGDYGAGGGGGGGYGPSVAAASTPSGGRGGPGLIVLWWF